ncbi:reverse transcriptase domain-containing protein [Tanacetum coccineum]|uniref:Reverse transcriptase domain-containing protein n=1 Tax=Tanacetum coccineum TaxID=301880 RepID=A0ABQ4ZFU5_9ASTR
MFVFSIQSSSHIRDRFTIQPVRVGEILRPGKTLILLPRCSPEAKSICADTAGELILFLLPVLETLPVTLLPNPKEDFKSTEDVQPPVVQIHHVNPNPEPKCLASVCLLQFLKASIPFPSRSKYKRRKEKANDQIEKFYEIFRDLSFEISFTDALMLMPKFASTLKTLIGNKEKLSELARTPLNENCSAVILNKLPKKLGDPGRFLIPCEFTGITTCNALADLGASINLMPYSQDVHLALKMNQPSSEVESTIYHGQDPEGDHPDSRSNFNSEPTTPPPNHEQYMPEVRKELKLSFLEGDDKLPVIIAKDLKDEEKAALLKVLKSHKRAIAWKLSDIKGVSPEFCTHKILMEEDYEPSVQSSEKGKPKIHDHPERPLPITIHGPNARETSRKRILLFPRWGFSGYFQIPIDPKDQEKTTFTCPYGTFAYRRMPFGLCNAPLLAVVYAFEKFRSYLVMSKSIVYTDHSAIKYLFAKKDVKQTETNLPQNVPVDLIAPESF